jgi:hypothetical protein
MKWLKRNIALACIFIGGGAFADNGKPLNAFYMGALFGQSSIDTDINNVVGATLEEEDTAYSFFIGSEVAENVSVEAFYINLGEASLVGENGDTFDIGSEAFAFNANGTIKATAKSMGIAAKLGFDITDKVNGFVKGGWHWWDSTATIAAGTTAASTTDNGSDLLLGLGIEYDINKKVAFIVGYDRYKFDEDNVAFLNAGIKVRF